MSLNLLFILATIAIVLMTRSIYKAVLRHIAAWQARDSAWQAIVLLLTGLLLVIVMLAWLYLIFVTFGSWYTSFDASRPKPSFVFMWAIGFFIYGFGINFVGSLHSLLMKDYEK